MPKKLARAIAIFISSKIFEKILKTRRHPLATSRPLRIVFFFTVSPPIFLASA